MDEPKPKSKRGFASMSPEKQREIASKGGKKAHATGKAHQFTSEQAREAGRKGGKSAHAKGTAHKFTPEEAAKAGRKGGLVSHSDAPKASQPVGGLMPQQIADQPVQQAEILPVGGANGVTPPIANEQQQTPNPGDIVQPS